MGDWRGCASRVFRAHSVTPMMNILLLATLTLVNPALTPGAVRPLTAAQVCSIRWGTDSRHVSASIKARVFEAYGIPVKDRGLYLIDHKIPRELAGSDEFANLWAERRDRAHAKDIIENQLHRDVCEPGSRMPLSIAQDYMRRWASE